ncbi:MAG TPA: hypothetical protein VHR72_11130 [Gemmataceae bacterium]|nr:hypothetical protein [Gemmataceae bacterium]
MNAPKTAVEPELPFESAWSHLECDCAAAGVEIVGAETVRAYLQEHPDTIDVTGQVCRSVRREFGSDAALRLSVYIDPEFDDRWLRVGVGVPNDSVEILERLRAITAALEEELYLAPGEISLMSDFVPSR